ncbi:ferrous iron transport protein B [Butyricimonas hominis]|uniref:Ferrous iron transport protein B n=1 Tax=Butyricimonas hominis TaxID=2763032 RepID=A0ABR7D6F1_9BACT|nr:ferrous iron transport protein B [Butyricimonas hominis]MBC5623337.1 ferrous iron transport protein B [Butyricimonas hominis]
MLLSELKTGESAVITKVKGYGAFRKRLNEMGFIRGKVVKAVKNAPLNDPIEYSIMGYEISLRRQEAAFIEIVSLEEASNIVGISASARDAEEAFAKHWEGRDKHIHVALVGNPNAGKTTLFNYMSGSQEHVGNYGGVTVDAKKATFRFNGYEFNVVDLPGTYSISAYSNEEKYVREYITNHAPDVVINVVDASNLERNLYLSTQLIDMDVKGVIALNMFDELERSGATFDYRKMGKMIGMPMVPTIGSKGKGVKQLLDEIIEVYEGRSETVRHIHINYGQEIEDGIVAIRSELADEKELTCNMSPRFMALMLLEGDKEITRFAEKDKPREKLMNTVQENVCKIESTFGESVEAVVTDTKYGFISGALKETYRESPVNRRRKTEYIDAIVTHKLFGFPIFLLFLFTTFFATFSLGSYPMEWIETGVAALSTFVENNMSAGPLKDLLVSGIIGGVGSVIVFLPNILILFLFISFMEDTGYMARAAFIMDKIMHKLGLHGKSFIPMIMGFGCNVPAIMSTRMLENRSDRILTILINPFMSCSARLPVYILLVGAFFKEYAALVLFGIYLIGILAAIVMAKLFKRVLFHKQEVPFVMELPPYRMPTLRTTIRHMWSKGEQYLKKMGGIIMLASIVIWALGYFPVDKELAAEYDKQKAEVAAAYEVEIASGTGNAEMLKAEQEAKLESLHREEVIKRQESSYISRIGRVMEPIWAPLGFEWKAGVSLLTGVAAKEIVVSTMAVLYQGEDIDEDDEAASSALVTRLKEHGFTPVIAIVFIVFVLLYSPCFAALIAIGKEIGAKWAFFVMGYTTVLAWVVCFVLKQALDLLI